MGPQGVQYAQVTSGQNVSTTVALLNNPRFVSLIIPAGVESGTAIRLKGAYAEADTFAFLRDPFTGSAQWLLPPTNPSSVPIGADISAVVAGFPYIQVALAGAGTHTAVNTITVYAKL